MGPMPQRQNKWVSGWVGVATPGLQADLGGCVWEGLFMLHCRQETDRLADRQTVGSWFITR